MSPTMTQAPGRTADASRGQYGGTSQAQRPAPTQEAQQHSEGPLARMIEDQTAKLPSDIFLWAALGSMGASLACHVAGRREDGHFFGQWAAPFLLLGVYNKLVKVAGSDRTEKS